MQRDVMPEGKAEERDAVLVFLVIEACREARQVSRVPAEAVVEAPADDGALAGDREIEDARGDRARVHVGIVGVEVYRIAE
jgi:hypothetical protein